VTDHELKSVFADEMQKLGVDVSTESGRAQFRADMAWSRASRERCEKIVGAGILFIVGGVLSIIGGWLLHGMYQTFSKYATPAG
jgi:hypothetical protein